MSLLFNANRLTNDFSPSIDREINKNDLKNITKELCRAYKKGMIPEDTFHEIIENLLVFFIDHSFGEKMLSKNNKLDCKLDKFNLLSKW